MAFIKKLQRISKDRTSIHDVVNASYTVFNEYGRTIFQIDTYGREDRECVGKVSQTVQFDKESARMLIEKLQDVFGLD